MSKQQKLYLSFNVRISYYFTKTKFAAKSSWNEKMLKNQYFNFPFQNLLLLRLKSHSNFNVTNGGVIFARKKKVAHAVQIEI